jgi:hypothetical protein
MENPRIPGSQDSGPRPASGLSYVWFVQDRSPHLLGPRLVPILCAAALAEEQRCAPLASLPFGGRAPPSASPVRVLRPTPNRRDCVPARLPAAYKQRGSAPGSAPSNPGLGLQSAGQGALRAGPSWNGQCLLQRWSCGGRGFAPGRQGSTSRGTPSHRTGNALREQRGGTHRHRPVARAGPRFVQPTTSSPDGRSPAPRPKASSLKEDHPVRRPLRSSRTTDRQRAAQRTGEQPGGSRARDNSTRNGKTTRRDTRSTP